MMEFPNIDINQVAVLISNAYTGQVFSANIEFLANQGEEIYLIFDKIEMALLWIDKIQKEHTDKVLEFTIYNKNQEMVKYINPFAASR